VELTVIGVTKSDDYSELFDMPAAIYMPVTTLMALYNAQTVGAIYVTVKDSSEMDAAARQLARLLSLRHNNKDRYAASNLMNQMDQINDILGKVTAFVGLIAGISLFVGGIGVMNIMLVTVTERTREIGIRKSLGATRGNIQFQFLIEAVVLAATGGVIGIVLGCAGGFILGHFIGITPIVSAASVALTVLISAAVGIIFGVYPASRAAALDPIEALRYE